MASIGRRGFVKGATLGALAFTVGGVEIIMAPGEARAKNVPFRWGELRIYLQVHVIRSLAYKVLLGRPFDVLTKSRTDHEEGRQLLTLTDPNSGRAWTVPTYDRPKRESGRKTEEVKGNQGTKEGFRIASEN